MPSLLTHYEFYKEVETNPLEIGFLGTQGPDPFFYYGFSFWPSKRAKSLRRFGNYLHEIDPYKTFEFIINYINDSTSEEKPILKNYLKGMIAHYVLDRVAHPYVFYISGFETEKEPDKKKYFLNHAKVESSIDVLVMEHFKDKTKTYEALNNHNYSLNVVSKMFYHLGKEGFDNRYITKNSYKRAIKVMRFVHIVLWSNTGKKKEFLDKYLKDTPLSVMSEPKIENIRLDYVNYGRKQWLDCVTGKNEKTSNFYDLINEAKEQYKTATQIVNDIFDGKKDFKQLKEFTNNITHHGFKVDATKKYFKSIYRNQED